MFGGAEMNGTIFIRLACVVLAILTAGCTTTFTYNGASYRSADAALAGQREHLKQVLSQITPAATTIPGAALVIVPTPQTLEALGITRKGSPPKEIIDFLVSSMGVDYGQFPEYLRAAKIFRSIDYRAVDPTALEARQVASNYAATIYLQLLSPTQVAWFLLKPDGGPPTEIHFDGTAASGAPRINSWLQRVAEIMSKSS